MRPIAVLGERDLSVTREPAASAWPRWLDLWTALAGGRAEAELIVGLRTVLRAGHHVLEVGSGSIARQVHHLEPGATVVVVELATLRELAFPDGAFDVVVCAWSLEEAREPRLAMAELARVLAPGGSFFACWRSIPDHWLARTSAALARSVVGRAGRRALRRDEETLPRLATTRISRFAGGLSTLVHARAPGPRGR